MCSIDPNEFCYVCGVLVKKKSQYLMRKMNTKNLSEAYKKYFGFRPASLDKPWTPNNACNNCRTILNKIGKGQECFFTFGKPVQWRNQINHTTDCYFCLTKKAIGRRIEPVYPVVSSATLPVPHSVSCPKPQLIVAGPTEIRKRTIKNDSSDECSESEMQSNKKPHLLTQAELNDLCRDLYLPKSKSELLASRLQQWGYCAPETRVTYYRDRSKQLALLFAKTANFCFCANICGLFYALQQNYDPEEWRLFLDGGKDSLKAVLLHKGNTKPSIPIGYGKYIKETYEAMKELLDLIHYDQHQWRICSDFKLVAILSGLQGGNTKFPCFLCLWDSRDRQNHYTQKVWPERSGRTHGEYNIKNDPLIPQEKIILPPLHIKLGLFTNIVKKLPKDSLAMNYLKQKFPRATASKIEAGIFDGPQIRALYGDQAFNECLGPAHLEAWEAFQDIVHNFLGNYRSPDYAEKIDTLLQKFNAIGKR